MRPGKWNVFATTTAKWVGAFYSLSLASSRSFFSGCVPLTTGEKKAVETKIIIWTSSMKVRYNSTVLLLECTESWKFCSHAEQKKYSIFSQVFWTVLLWSFRYSSVRSSFLRQSFCEIVAGVFNLIMDFEVSIALIYISFQELEGSNFAPELSKLFAWASVNYRTYSAYRFLQVPEPSWTDFSRFQTCYFGPKWTPYAFESIHINAKKQNTA